MGRNGKSRLCVKYFLSQRTEKPRNGNLCFRIIVASKNFWIKRWWREGVSRFSVENLFFSQYGGTWLSIFFCVIRKHLVSEKLKNKRGGGREGVSRFSVENSWSLGLVPRKIVG